MTAGVLDGCHSEGGMEPIGTKRPPDPPGRPPDEPEGGLIGPQDLLPLLRGPVHPADAPEEPLVLHGRVEQRFHWNVHSHLIKYSVISIVVPHLLSS